MIDLKFIQEFQAHNAEFEGNHFFQIRSAQDFFNPFSHNVYYDPTSMIDVKKYELRLKKPFDQKDYDPKFLPRIVDYTTEYPPGTIMIDSAKKFLYLIEKEGKARRYRIGVGRKDMSWKGIEVISHKAEWPDWRPPLEMIRRERQKGRILPNFVPGGFSNPLGARAIYLGRTLYRIHGTNAPWSIGRSVTSGCIRMRNKDVKDLYDRVRVGAKVVVM